MTDCWRHGPGNYLIKGIAVLGIPDLASADVRGCGPGNILGLAYLPDRAVFAVGLSGKGKINDLESGRKTGSPSYGISIAVQRYLYFIIAHCVRDMSGQDRPVIIPLGNINQSVLRFTGQAEPPVWEIAMCAVPVISPLSDQVILLVSPCLITSLRCGSLTATTPFK